MRLLEKRTDVENEIMTCTHFCTVWMQSETFCTCCSAPNSKVNEISSNLSPCTRRAPLELWRIRRVFNSEVNELSNIWSRHWVPRTLIFFRWVPNTWSSSSTEFWKLTLNSLLVRKNHSRERIPELLFSPSVFFFSFFPFFFSSFFFGRTLWERVKKIPSTVKRLVETSFENVRKSLSY